MTTNRDAPSPVKIIDVGIGIVIRRAPDIVRNGASVHEILVTRRKRESVFGGYWELPGGKVEGGESIDACVVRELLEEVGVSARVTGALGDVVHTYPHGTVRLHPRLCEMEEGSAEPRALHVAEFAWCALGRLGEYEFPPANEGIVKELRERLGG